MIAIPRLSEKSTAQTSDPLVELNGWKSHETIFVYCLFIIFAAAIKIIYHRYKRISHFIPESCVFILIGCCVDRFLSETSSVLDRLKPTFTTELFFMLLLPPIMLESAYSLNHKYFYINIGPILLYAIVGTVINIAAIGPSLYAVIQFDTNKWLNIPNISLLELMIFGASLSAIDPVSVLAIFKDLKVNNSLYYLVFGESLLNDAVVLVIHRILFHLLQTSQAVTGKIFLLGLAKFLIVSLGSLSIGFLYGALSSLLTLITSHVQEIEPILMIVLAYTAYVSAEIFEWSGVISIIGCGLFQAEYAFKNISTRSRITVQNYIITLSAISDVIIFIFIGMILVQIKHLWNTSFVVFTAAFCVLYRFLSVISLTFIVNRVLKTPIYIKFSEQLLMVHAGLRGAIAYVLISMLNDSNEHGGSGNNHNDKLSKEFARISMSNNRANSNAPHHQNRQQPRNVSGNNHASNLINVSTFQLLQTTTLFIILATVFLMGSTTKPLLNYLKIKREIAFQDRTLFQQINNQIFDDINNSILGIISERKSGGRTLNSFSSFLNK